MSSTGRYDRIAAGVRRRESGEWDEAAFADFVGGELEDHRRWEQGLREIARSSGLWWLSPEELSTGWEGLRTVEGGLEELGEGRLESGLAAVRRGLEALREAMRVKA